MSVATESRNLHISHKSQQLPTFAVAGAETTLGQHYTPCGQQHPETLVDIGKGPTNIPLF